MIIALQIAAGIAVYKATIKLIGALYRWQLNFEYHIKIYMGTAYIHKGPCEQHVCRISPYKIFS